MKNALAINDNSKRATENVMTGVEQKMYILVFFDGCFVE